MEIHSTEMSQGENDYEKDLQQLYSIAGKIGEGTQKAESFFSSACIYRVPEKLRKLKESAYTPHLIAIGPLHREDEHLQTPLQHVKLSYTNYLLSRLATRMEGQLELAEQKKLTVLQECLAELKKSVDDAKKYYAEEVTLDEEMMLVDGCFILEFLYRSFHGPPKGQETDPIFGNPLTVYHVENDLVLLENQIPFFVLEKLFQLTVHWIPNRPGENCSLIDYVRQCYCDKIMSPVGKSANAKTRCSPSDTVLTLCGSTAAAAEEEEVRSGNNDDHRTTANYYYHILHNLHDGCLRLLQSEPRNLKSDAVHIPSALDLNYAGVKFVPNVSGSHLFNFTEPKGLFWMWCWAHFVVPPLEILDYTELYLRNLIAFEQCCPGILQNVTSYAYVMSMLVNTDKDVQVLEKAGVMINHFFARKDATNLLTSLCKETALRELIFADACIDAIRYSKRCWSKNMAACRYFVAPWTFSAFVVGFISFAIHVFDFVRKFLNKEKVV